MSRLLIAIGVVLVAAGFLWPRLMRAGLGHLPGDIVIHRGNTTFYAPIVTCLLVSVALSLLFWVLRR